MRLRTTVFLWVLILVVVIVGATIGTIAVVFDRSTRARLADELELSTGLSLSDDSSPPPRRRLSSPLLSDSSPEDMAARGSAGPLRAARSDSGSWK